MSAIHIRNVPDATVAALRERASRRGVSMQQELRRILNEVAAEPVEAQEVEPLDLVTVARAQATTWPREEVYDDGGR